MKLNSPWSAVEHKHLTDLRLIRQLHTSLFDNYCIFHVTYPTPQFELHSQPIFKTPLLAQFLMECLEILYIVFYIYYIGAPTTTSSNSIFLIFRFFMPSPQGSTVIGRLLYKLERVWYPEKIHMYFSV